MSAKHKRPFVVFAAVALICGMVLVTGAISKADNGRAPEHSAGGVATSDPPVSRLPEHQGPATIDPSQESDSDPEGGSSEETDTSDPSEFEALPTDDGGSDTGDDNGATDPFDYFVGPPLPDPDDVPGDDVPGDDEADQQDDEGKRDGKGRGGRGKKDKDDEDDNDGDDASDGSDEEEPADEYEPTEEPADEGELPSDEVDVDVPFDETPSP